MMMNLLKIPISIVIIALVSLLLNILNSKKNRRIRHFSFLVFTVALAIASIIYLIIKEDNIGILFSSYYFIPEYLKNANLLAFNLGLMIAFFSVKLMVRPIVTSIFKSKKVLSAFHMNIYEYDDEYEEWFLKKQCVNLRVFFFSILLGLIIFSGIILGFVWMNGSESSFFTYSFPCIAVIIFNEIYAYVNGQTKEEYEISVFGEDALARKVHNYYLLRRILEQLLPMPLLSAYTGCEFVRRNSSSDFLKKLSESEDINDKVTAEYFNEDGRFKTADIDGVQASLSMMHRHNVVFFNPFYRDLSMYIILPLTQSLLAGKKGLVLCGRKNTAPDVKIWLTQILSEYSHMQTLWRVDYLSDKEPECEVGLLSFTQIYDKNVINNNKNFFNDVDFVMLIEPSLILNTSQIALSILSEEMNQNEEKPVYCICDRQTEGLVDTVSHLIQSEITDVVAMPVPRCDYSAMSWDADGDFCRQQFFDKQTRYLGNGVELAAIAVKNQIPHVTWYSERKAPVKDIKWIAGQYHSTVCRYMNQPAQQKALYDKVKFVSSLWSNERTKEQFIIVEDEFCNMFNTMRAYLSRGIDQVFVNVLSEDYLLRDYMRCNRQMFTSNPDSIPSYVPDYAKTERNIIIKLLLKMTLRPVPEEEVLEEFHLIGIDTADAFNTLHTLINKYTYADDTVFEQKNDLVSIDGITTKINRIYRVSPENFERYFSESLKNAYYILEDEKREEGYIDAKLFSHVTQTILPGQFVTYDGKYYQAKYVSPKCGVVLRRASDQYEGRKYYRQIRKYYIDFESANEIVSDKTIMDIGFTEVRVDLKVSTTGYLEMSDNHDLRNARIIDFTNDPSVESYNRKYHNKSIIKVKLPEADEKICFTLCMLLSEIFRTVFPDGWYYLAALTKMPEDVDGVLNYVVYPVDGEVEDGYIYLIEDSDVDLGLLSCVEKNFMTLMEIIADFLDWHFEKLKEPAYEDPIPVSVKMKEDEEKKKRGLMVKMLDRIKKLFGKDKEESVELESVDQVEKRTERESRKPFYENRDSDDNDDFSNSSIQNDLSVKEYELGLESEKDQQGKATLKTVIKPAAISKKKGNVKASNPDIEYMDGTDIFEEDAQARLDYRIEDQLDALSPIEKTRYQKECYLKFGYNEFDERIHADDLRKYLRVRGWCKNNLFLARRKGINIEEVNLETGEHCDFCHMPLNGVSYEVLNDGRIRCNDCSSSAISTTEEFKTLFFQSLNFMKNYFNIRFTVPIGVKVVDASAVAKGAGAIYRVDGDKSGRYLGYAQKKRDKYYLLIENGSPRLAAIDTIIHEMTHIWQFFNWDEDAAKDIYGKHLRNPQIALDLVYEGMAMWASIQYLYEIGEICYAEEQERMAETRQDVYGKGFEIYKKQYPLLKDSALLKQSPFMTFPPVEPSEVRAVAELLDRIR